MLQAMGISMGPREYVIEKGETSVGASVHVAYWRDHTGMASFGARTVFAAETAAGVREVMDRHYPGAVCVYMPEDVAALIAAAIRATQGPGGDGGDRGR